MKYHPQMDTLRAIAVFGPICAHSIRVYDFEYMSWNVMLPWLEKYSHGGVILFFVISGFLITGILMDTPDIKRFYIRRFLRILPAYYLLVLLYRPDAREFWWVITYTLNWVPFVPDQAIGHFWSLCVEEQFYLIWPWLVCFTPNKHRPWLFLGTIAFSLAYKSVMVRLHQPDLALLGTLGCMDQLSLGALTAWMLRNKPDSYKKYLFSVLVIAALPFAFVQVKHVIFWKFVIALVCVPIVGSSVFPYRGLLKRVFAFRPLQYMGRISYGLYLYHLPVFAVDWMSARGRYGYWTCWLAYFICTLAVASLSWHLFEKPLNNLKRRFPYRALV